MSLVHSLNEPYLSRAQPRLVEEDTTWLNEIVNQLIKEHAQLLSKVDTGQVSRKILETEIIKIMDQRTDISNRSERIREVFNHMFGYGILQKYLENPDLTDLIGTRYDSFFMKREGKTIQIPVAFPNETAFENYLKLIVVRNGGMLNENDNHARVADEGLKLRINAVISPRSGTGPFLAIRKHRSKIQSLEELLRLNLLDKESLALVQEIALSSSRFVICGKGASGKTTLMRAMIKQMGVSQRLLICESDTEIYPDSPTMVAQKVIERGDYGKSVSLEKLVQDGLTMSLDGYCIGEITGREAWDFVKAGYTDHRVMATLHSLGAQDALHRLLILSEVATLGISESMAVQMIEQSLDYILYMKDFKLMSIDRLSRNGNQRKEMERIYERGSDPLCSLAT